jgi:hypothetical protein
MPMVLAPSLKITVPVALAGVTVAVRITVCPLTAGLGEGTSAVTVLAGGSGFTTSVTVCDVLGLLLLSPL